MSADVIIGVPLCIAVLVYLVYTLLKPERF